MVKPSIFTYIYFCVRAQMRSWITGSASESGITESFVDAWSFGDNPELADDLLELVSTGEKTGTETLVIELEREGWKMPERALMLS